MCICTQDKIESFIYMKYVLILLRFMQHLDIIAVIFRASNADQFYQVHSSGKQSELREGIGTYSKTKRVLLY